jgi:hypothetical protein
VRRVGKVTGSAMTITCARRQMNGLPIDLSTGH